MQTSRPAEPELKGVLIMDKKKEIVYFEELGFGWLLDKDMLDNMREKQAIEQIMIQRSLAELFRSRKRL
jgi:hypothetical protein